MAKAKKFASMELTNAKGKAIETRGIDATGETVKVSVDGKDVSVAIPEAVTDYVMLSEQEKSLKEKKDRAAEAIRAFVKEVREFFAARKDLRRPIVCSVLRLLICSMRWMYPGLTSVLLLPKKRTWLHLRRS